MFFLNISNFKLCYRGVTGVKKLNVFEIKQELETSDIELIRYLFCIPDRCNEIVLQSIQFNLQVNVFKKCLLSKTCSLKIPILINSRSN